MRTLCLLALFVVAVSAAPRTPSRIVGGELTTIDKYPSMAVVLFTPNFVIFGHTCGGTIINNRSVLSAAHCVSGAVETLRIRVGSSFAHSGGEVLPLGTIIVHPDYIPTAHDHDVAIFRTSVEISYSDLVQPAPIAGPSYNLADDEVVWATGWGRIEFLGQTSEQLRDVQVFTINQETCRLRYLFFDRITSDMLCTGWLDVGGKDQCQGDSGGPVYHNGVVVGVCSFGRGCASPVFPGVNARVSSYSTWIQANA